MALQSSMEQHLVCENRDVVSVTQVAEQEDVTAVTVPFSHRI